MFGVVVIKGAWNVWGENRMMLRQATSRPRHFRNLTLPTAFVVLASLAACGDEIPTASPPVVLEPPTLKAFASSLSIALNSGPHVRDHVRNEMRKSPWGKHILDLKTFSRTDEGRRIVRDASATLGATPREMSEMLSLLPPIDFYLASTEHRLTWEGDGPVFVMVDPPGESPPTMLDEEGQVIPLNSARVRRTPVMVLAPAGRRVLHSEGSAPPGEAIEAPGEHAVEFRSINLSTGDTTRAGAPDFDGRIEQKKLMTASLGSGQSTYIEEIEINWCAETMAYFQDHELLVKAWFYSADGTLEGYGEFYDATFPMPSGCDAAGGFSYEGQAGELYDPMQVLINHALPDNSAHRIELEVWEADPDPDSDDFAGSATIDWQDHQVLMRAPSCSSCTTIVHLEWSALSPSVLTSREIHPDPVVVTEGLQAQRVRARALDQYGYGLSGYPVSSWWTGDVGIAQVSSDGSYHAWVQGISDGFTTVNASFAGGSESAVVDVRDCSQGCTEFTGKD